GVLRALRLSLRACAVPRRPLIPARLFQAAEWISLERHCCPFLNFGLELKDDGDVSLSLTGSDAVRALLDDEMRLLQNSNAATSVPTAPAMPPPAKPAA